MTKIAKDLLINIAQNILTDSNEIKKRNFIETIELQVVLKNYDVYREKRFSGNIRLRNAPKLKYRVCVYGDERHCDEARANNISYMSVDDLKRLNKNKKLIKKLEHKYDVFLASDTIIRQIPRLLGPGLGKAGKFPTLITHDDNLMEKIAQLKSTVRFRLKKTSTLNVAVGNVTMNSQQLVENINTAINFLISLLRKRWHHVRALYLKSTMGKSYRLY